MATRPAPGSLCRRRGPRAGPRRTGQRRPGRHGTVLRAVEEGRLLPDRLRRTGARRQGRAGLVAAAKGPAPASRGLTRGAGAPAGYRFGRTVLRDPEIAAAIDLGSNSFHLLIARVEDGQLKVVDRLRESVRLGGGLDETNYLTSAAMERGLETLARFGQRLREFPPGSVRAVGTNTLRKARNSRRFLDRARDALGHEIDIVSGYEEARLIYLGVAHSLADDGQQRLVVDIGGGSTELITGEGFAPRLMESLHMGCVSLMEAHFQGGGISSRRMQRAVLAARMELEPIESRFREEAWQRAVGASGTVRAIQRVVQEAGWSDYGITASSLKQLRKALVEAGHVDKIRFSSLSRDRAEIFPGGVAVLVGVFEALGIERMEAADGAMREGLLYDLLGRIQHEDVRALTVEALARRYHADTEHAGRVGETALGFLEQARNHWRLGEPIFGRALAWAASLHEIGLDISHSQYHKHGAYVLRNADMAGFSKQEQLLLASLVRTHRRKFPRTVFEELPDAWTEPAQRLAILLRLSVRLHRGRGRDPLPSIVLKPDGRSVALHFPDDWLADHPLAEADLEEEAGYLRSAGYRLICR
ncbi:exopolyphosphatase [Ectothiorhodospiraceae bacterium WFHF3C12]|nr:exopolyphosphatase [Ectothiorhodospiraceae bacterium WFHF3C12]